MTFKKSVVGPSQKRSQRKQKKDDPPTVLKRGAILFCVGTDTEGEIGQYEYQQVIGNEVTQGYPATF